MGCEITMKITSVATYFHISFKNVFLITCGYFTSEAPIFLALSTSELKNNAHFFFTYVLSHGKNLGSVRMKSKVSKMYNHRLYTIKISVNLVVMFFVVPLEHGLVL